MRLPADLAFRWKASWGDPGAALDDFIQRVSADGGGMVRLVPIGGDPWDLALRTYTSQISGSASGVYGIMLRDGVTLVGPGRGVPCLRLKDSAFGAGAYGRLITSLDGTRLTNAGLRDLDVDGNVSGQNFDAAGNNQVNGILLEAASNVHVERCSIHDTNGTGSMVRGTVANPCSTISQRDNVIDNIGNIGLQCSQFDQLVMSGNIINGCLNNGIDIYGDAGASSPPSQGTRFAIVSNTIHDTLGGIFPETVLTGTINGNVVTGSTYGVTCNRIYSPPGAINISGNTFSECDYGVRVTGDQGQLCAISDNLIILPNAAGIRLGGGGNVSKVVVTGNTALGTNSTVPWLQINAAQTTEIRAVSNFQRLMAAYSETITTKVSTVVEAAINVGSAS